MSEAGPFEVVVATSNRGKIREIREILADLPLALRALEGGLRMPEEGDDYEANALEKARFAAAATGQVAVADDSGLEVAGLGGGPGPRSARFGGPGLDDAGRVRALLAALASRPGASREARFVCIAAVSTPEGDAVSAPGECRGRILEAPRGAQGFGYDPVFEVEGRGVAMAEVDPDEKNRISHRARAFRALRGAILARLASAEAARS